MVCCINIAIPRQDDNFDGLSKLGVIIVKLMTSVAGIGVINTLGPIYK